MDKALMRARMKEAAKKKEKRINSPLVRYNELDLAVCKVCNVVIKSEILWNPHLASRAHKEAAEKIKACAAKATQKATKSQTIPIAPSPSPSPAAPPPGVSGVPADFFDSSSAPNANLPADFFDSSTAPSAKKSRINGNEHATTARAPAQEEWSVRKSQNGTVEPSKPSPLVGDENVSKVPEGFFDNVDADHRARGLEPPKVDIKEEYKEFQKSIKEDLMEADVHQEEDEEEAADVREGFEEIEQRTLRDRVEMLRRVKEERVAKMKAEHVASFPAAMGIDAEDDSEDDDSSIDLDWRAKEL